jgi:hypothetical protein
MRFFAAVSLFGLLAGPLLPLSLGQQAGGRKEFPPGQIRRSADLPASRLRDQIERLPAPARERAVAWLANSHITQEDFPALHADNDGAIFYVDHFEHAPAAENAPAEPEVATAPVPVDPFPAALVFHSKPGSQNVLYLDFTGESIIGTAWNDSVGRTSIPAVAFSTDSDLSTFSDAERLAIKRIWQRVAEDYAPFDIDVTTERPDFFNSRTAHALITRNTDANGARNPASDSGGVAYLNVFGTTSYSKYRPAWIYSSNLGGDESFIAEALSHEVGHNLGLSHDGTTDGADYYGGHGSGETSWAPLMGTGYNRNMSQWSNGDYYNANNTQDDLATIASKLTYRFDDHADALNNATPLVVSATGAITSTTPETDPQNSSRANKGVIDRSYDVDIFSFTTGAGAVTLNVTPWVVPAGKTRGGNVDIALQLYNSAGQLLLTANPPTTTAAQISTNLPEGVYRVIVRSTGVGYPGDPLPSGYSSYSSMGQYFINGAIVPSGPAIPPTANLTVSDLSEPGVSTKTFTVRYSDNVAINTSSIGNNDIRVTGPNGYSQVATFVSIDQTSNGTPRTATYRITAPGAEWTESSDGLYTISMLANSVADTEGAVVAAGDLGSFRVAIPRAIYVALMDTNPGWTLEGLWQHGRPLYVLSGPTSAPTGTNILGYNLLGNYENRLSPVYATTPPINCVGASSLTLRFKRYLGLKSGDIANIQISTNATDWSDLWSTSATVADTSWQTVQYPLPSWVAGAPALQLRWGMASGQTQNDIGWNIDDVLLLVNGPLDTTAPTATIGATTFAASTSTPRSFAVTYFDNTAISVASIGATDIIVRAPNGSPLSVEFTGIDDSTDGTPRTATYSVTAPDGSWDSADSGTYQIILQNGEVRDVVNNAAAQTLLGTFTVEISAPATAPQIVSISNNGTSSSITVDGTAGLEHILEASNNFSTWTAIATNTPTTARFILQDSTTGATRFYRVTTR